MRTLAYLLLLLTLPSIALAERDGATERFSLELEGGVAWQNRNDVEIPNDGTATRFSLEDLVGMGPWAAGRVQLTWNLSDRHGLRALAAPFQYSERGYPADVVRFVGGTFAAGAPVEATYRFNSWRVGYCYRFSSGERWRWWIGFTAKIRDAEIALRQEAVSTSKTDVGFVPLLHLSGEWTLGPRWRAMLEVEALGGGPGRAEDAALKIAYDLDHRWALAAGVRTLEGGADVDEVYNFAWFNYAVLSVVYRWP